MRLGLKTVVGPYKCRADTEAFQRKKLSEPEHRGKDVGRAWLWVHQIGLQRIPVEEQ